MLDDSVVYPSLDSGCYLAHHFKNHLMRLLREKWMMSLVPRGYVADNERLVTMIRHSRAAFYGWHGGYWFLTSIKRVPSQAYTGRSWSFRTNVDTHNATLPEAVVFNSS